VANFPRRTFLKGPLAHEGNEICGLYPSILHSFTFRQKRIKGWMVVLQYTSLSTRVLEEILRPQKGRTDANSHLCRTTKNRDILGEETNVSQMKVRLFAAGKRKVHVALLHFPGFPYGK
jgi:hypothetical protein